MRMKTCSKCKVEKELSEFCNRKANKDGLNGQCKSCVKARDKAYNSDPINKANKKAKQKTYREDPINKAKNKAYNSDPINKANIKTKNNERSKRRKKEDPVYRLKCRMSSMMADIFNRSPYKKGSRKDEIIGCSHEDLIIHLENNIYGFTIDELGKDGFLDLDHIVPISTYTSEEDIYKLNHYTNFQLLPSAYNQYVKRDKDWDREDFENWLSLNSINPTGIT